MSQHMRAQRHHPMDDAIWLLEHVSKTKGAQYLKLSSARLNLFDYYGLDLVLAAAALLKVTIIMLERSRGSKLTKTNNFNR
jgi:hypothetical protein